MMHSGLAECRNKILQGFRSNALKHRNSYSLSSASWCACPQDNKSSHFPGYRKHRLFQKPSKVSWVNGDNFVSKTLGTAGVQNSRNIFSISSQNRQTLDKFSSKVKHCGQIGGARCLSLSTTEILKASPSFVQPYLRLIRFDKPIGTYLLFWPCTWSIGLAAEAGHLPDLYMLALFGAGAFVMRGAGCIINDMWDKDIDKMVERTKIRPLASEELSQFKALVFLGGNLSVALAILLQLNWFSVILGAASMGLVITYPLAKRYTYWPQVVLGLTLNWGVLLAWAGSHGTLELPAICLYLSCTLYTMFYDTIYSHQDKYDDMLIGVKSTALKFGEQTKPWLAGFSSLMIAGLVSTGMMCDQTWPYYAAVAATAAHLGHQMYTVDLDNPSDCLKKFKSNANLGVIMFIGIVLGTLVKPTSEDENKKKEQQSTA